MVEASKPVYQRLREHIAAAILAGEFQDGDPLPSVRALAAEQEANPLTVAKAYQTFQDDGLVVVRRGVGMFVAEGATDRLRAQLRDAFLKDVWPPVAQQARLLRVDLSRLLETDEA